MANEEVYIARLGAWIARALGDAGSFAADPDIDGLGFQMPEAIVADSGVQAAGLALTDAGTLLNEAPITSGDQAELIGTLLWLFEGIQMLIVAMHRIVNRIDARAATRDNGLKGSADLTSQQL